MKRLIRLLLFLLNNLFFLGLATIIAIIFLPMGKKIHRKVTTFLVPIWSNIILFIFGIRVKLSHPELMDNSQNYFIVGNHLSYLDVIFVGKYFPVLFVAKKEVKKWPLFGTLAWLGGMLFIDRSIQGAVHRPYVEQIANELKNGFHISIFPEGTSTNGETVLPFKKTIFSCPVMAQVPILPIAIKYVSINNEKFGPMNRDLVCWYGDMTFVDHFWTMLNLKQFQVEIVLNKPYLEAPADDWIQQNSSLAAKIYAIVKSSYLLHHIKI